MLQAHKESNLAAWNNTQFEDDLEKSLKTNLGEESGSAYFARYVEARTALLENVLDKINGAQPELTDHGPDHIRHVLENVHALLEVTPEYFRPIELYVLGLGVLFHDVGNLEGREGHSRRVARFYDFVRPQADRQQEKSLVVQICGAHSGVTRNGSKNTLEEVPDSTHLDGQPIRAREIAAIIRFADELAEGPRRTSQYLLATSSYSPDSTPFHDYASATNLCIDGHNGRIAVTYHLQVDSTKSLDEELRRVEDMLEMVHSRLTKMNLERRYARFHCATPLLPFREISVRIEVQLDGEFLDLGLETCVSDAVDLDQSAGLLFDHNEKCLPAAIVAMVRKEIASVQCVGASGTGSM